MKKTDEQNPVS